MICSLTQARDRGRAKLPEIFPKSLTIGDADAILASKSCLYKSVRKLHAGLHSFRSISLIEARRKNASAF